MKYQEYIEKIGYDEDDFKAGLLSELELQVPQELHGSIMQAIKRENSRVKYSRYKKFTAAAAAILVFAVSMTTIMSAIRNEFKMYGKKSESTALNSAAQNQVKLPETYTQEKTKDQPPVENKTKEQNTTLNANVKGLSISEPANKTKIVPQNKTRKLATNNRGKESDINSSTNQKQPEISALLTLSDENQKPDDNSTDTVQIQRMQPNPEIITKDSDSGLNVFKMTLVVPAKQVDYEFTIGKNQTDVLSFINSDTHAVLVDREDGIYRMKRQDFIMLNYMINKENAVYGIADASNINTDDRNIKDFVLVKISIK